MVFGVVLLWLWVREVVGGCGLWCFVVPQLGLAAVVGDSVVCMGCLAFVWRLRLMWLVFVLVVWLAVAVGVGMLVGAVFV